MPGRDNKNNKSLGLTLIEALVSAAIVGIGFISIFQMVNYAVQSIDVSGERTKTNYLVSMVAEDLMADRDSEDGGKKFYEHLLTNKWNNAGNSSDADFKGWEMTTCKPAPTTSGSHTYAPSNKIAKWNKRFATERVKCRGAKDKKGLKIFEICYTGCTYTNTQSYFGGDKRHFGRMEVNLNNGKKRKYLYFQIN